MTSRSIRRLLCLLAGLLFLAKAPSLRAENVFCHGKGNLAEEMVPYMHGIRPGNGFSSQGMCLAGDYIIYTRYRSDSQPTIYEIIDSRTGRKIGSYRFNTLHSNSLTYNPDRQEIVCVSQWHAFIFSFYDGRMRLIRDTILPRNCCKIAYVPSLQCYYLATDHVVYRTRDFVQLERVFQVSAPAISQGMAFDGRYLYIIWYRVGQNTLSVYTPSGEPAGSWIINSSIYLEVEEVDFLEDKMLINIAHSGARNGLYTVDCQHDYSSWITGREASCSEDGEKIRTCRRCLKKDSRPIPATGKHRPGKWIVKKKADCLTDGEKIRSCLLCKKVTDQRILPSKGHSYSKWKTITKPEVLLAGCRVHYCKTCRLVEKEEIPPLKATIFLSKSNLFLSPGESTDPIDVHLAKGDRIVCWESENPGAVSVDKGGRITAHRPGKTRLLVRSAGGACQSVTVRVGLFPLGQHHLFSRVFRFLARIPFYFIGRDLSSKYAKEGAQDPYFNVYYD